MARASAAKASWSQLETPSEFLWSIPNQVVADKLHTAPGRCGGGGAGTTWLLGSADDVAASLRKYQALGITHFVLSDTSHLTQIARQGQELLPLLRR